MVVEDNPFLRGDTPKKSLGNGAFFMVAMDPALTKLQQRRYHLCVLKYALRYSQPRIGKGIPGSNFCKEPAMQVCKEALTLHCFALGQIAGTLSDIRP
jgi:hypothetical protein